MKHPTQPLFVDSRGLVRFKKNAIVRWMLDRGREGKPFDLNLIATMDCFTSEDRSQLAQLIGYSVHGYNELPYVTDEDAAAVNAVADTLALGGAGCRAHGCEVHGGVRGAREPRED